MKISFAFAVFTLTISQSATAFVKTVQPNEKLQSKINEISVSLEILNGLKSIKPLSSQVSLENLEAAKTYDFTYIESSFDWKRTQSTKGKTIRDYIVRLSYQNDTHTQLLMSLIMQWIEEGFTVEQTNVVKEENIPSFVTTIQYRLVR